MGHQATTVGDMARYEITSPDGKRFEITAPDDATSDQVLEYTKSQWLRTLRLVNPALQAEDVPGIGQTLLIGAGRTSTVSERACSSYLLVLKKRQAQKQRQSRTISNIKSPKTLVRLQHAAIGESIPSMVVLLAALRR